MRSNWRSTGGLNPPFNKSSSNLFSGSWKDSENTNASQRSQRDQGSRHPILTTNFVSSAPNCIQSVHESQVLESEADSILEVNVQPTIVREGESMFNLAPNGACTTLGSISDRTPSTSSQLTLDRVPTASTGRTFPERGSPTAALPGTKDRFDIESATLDSDPAANRFSIHGEFFHCMISYRVATEGDQGNGIALQLYKELKDIWQVNGFNATFAYGRWPNFARPPAKFRNGDAKMYLDVMCLRNGENWEAGHDGNGGFIGGVTHSLVFVPILSWYPDGRGSVGQLANLDPEQGKDWVDNFLLEITIALYLQDTGFGGIKNIFPVMLGEKDKHGRYEPFPFNKLDQLADCPSHATNKRAMNLLHRIGLGPRTKLEEAMLLQLSVRGAIRAICAHQAIKFSDEGIHFKAVESCATAIIDCVHRIMQSLVKDREKQLQSRSNVSRHKPHHDEVQKWLLENGIWCYRQVLASQNLYSLTSVACLRARHVHQLARMVCAETRGEDEQSEKMHELLHDIGMEVELAKAVNILKDDPRSWTVSKRMRLYQDHSAGLFTGLVSSNILDVGCGRVLIRVLAFLMSIQSLWLAIGHLNQDIEEGYLKYPDRDEFIEPLETRWTRFLTFALVISLALWGPLFSPWIGTKIPGLVIKYGLATSVPFYLVKCLLDYIQCHTEGHGIGKYCNGQVSLIALLLVLTVVILVCIIPRYFWVGVLACYFLYSVVAALGATGFGAAAAVNVMVACCYLIALIGIVHARRTAKRRALQSMKQIREEYDFAWSSLMRNENSQEAAMELLHETNHARDRINQVQQKEKTNSMIASMKLWSGLEESRYTKSGKAKQRTQNIDRLFQLAELLSFDFQEFISTLISVGCVVPGPVKKPERAITKAVRSYDRDASCLLDLVRCCIVVETFSEACQCFHDIVGSACLSESLDHPDNLNELTSRGPKGEVSMGSSGVLSRQLSDASTTTSQQVRQMLRVTFVNNLYDPDFESRTGYRHLSLNVEVGWRQHHQFCEFLPVREWSSLEGTQTMVCEVQILVKQFYDIKVSRAGTHCYQRFRDEMVQ